MKKIILSAAALLLMTVACKKAEDKAVDVNVVTTDTTVVTTETAAAPMDSVAMMKAWESYATPGDMHKMFASENGKWDAAMTMWMAPDAPPTKNTMTAESRMILGGRYQEIRYTGDFMGEKFEGIGTMAYDNASNKVVSSWIDNMGTGMMYMSGDYNADAKTVELKGEVTDPVTKKLKAARETYTYIDDNTRKMEMYDVTPDGKEYKSMEIVLTRKK